uniref:Small ribosomal subunit protein uS17 n=1 Tax=Tortanus dextrilobatus TaxID=207953 RepID=A0A0U2UQC2_9MAXI|nr:40S ribosomal protein S11 [Tortanus dextrilobatus]
MADQLERAFQKQPPIFQNKKGGLKPSEFRFFYNPGLGFKIPVEARTGKYVDKKCPFPGKVSIRGRVFTGMITKKKKNRNVVIRRGYLPYVKKYNRFEKRHKNKSVHLSPCFRGGQVGGPVAVGGGRPLSKTVKFNPLKVPKGQASKKSFAKF